MSLVSLLAQGRKQEFLKEASNALDNTAVEIVEEASEFLAENMYSASYCTVPDWGMISQQRFLLSHFLNPRNGVFRDSGISVTTFGKNSPTTAEENKRIQIPGAMPTQDEIQQALREALEFDKHVEGAEEPNADELESLLKKQNKKNVKTNRSTWNLNEDVVSTLEKISSSEGPADIKFDTGSVATIEPENAKKLVVAISKMPPADADKFKNMLKKNAGTFMTAVNIALR